MLCLESAMSLAGAQCITACTLPRVPTPVIKCSRVGACVGDSVPSVNVTLFSTHDLRSLALARPGQSQLADWNNTTTAEPSLYC